MGVRYSASDLRITQKLVLCPQIVEVGRGKFGRNELQAHMDAAEQLGRHRALHEAAELAQEIVHSNQLLDGRLNVARMFYPSKAR